MAFKPLIPLAVLAVLAVLILLPLVALVDLPGEQWLKEAVGYPTGGEGPPCGVTDAGTAGAWRASGAMPSLRDGPSSARVGDTIYLVGGVEGFTEDFATATSSALVEAYDTETDRWERLPPLPRPLNHVNLAAWGGELYVLGGKLNDYLRGATTTDSWRLDRETRTWEAIASVPTARAAAGVAVVDDRIYVIGGYTSNVPLDAVESFDPRTNTWEEHADMPTPRDHHGVAARDGMVYAFGGRQADLEGLPTLERYDVERDLWEGLPDGPYRPAGFTFVATPAGLVAAGGESLSERILFGSVWAYAPEDGSWTRLPSMTPPKHGQGSAYVDGRLWVLGGSTCAGFAPVDSVEYLPLAGP